MADRLRDAARAARDALMVYEHAVTSGMVEADLKAACTNAESAIAAVDDALAAQPEAPTGAAGEPEYHAVVVKWIAKGGRFCLSCERHDHSTEQCWSTGGLNTEAQYETSRLCSLARAAAPHPYAQGEAPTAPSAEPPHVDWLGLALDLEHQALRVESQTVQRAMMAGAHGLRLFGAAPTVAAPAASEVPIPGPTAVQIVKMVADDFDVCIGERGVDYQPVDLSTETIDALIEYQSERKLRRLPLDALVMKTAAPAAGEPTRCHSDCDGDCIWSGCPQMRDGEPHKTGRHCPLDIDRSM